MPGGLLRRAEHGRAAQQGTHAIAAHFGRRMQPAEGAHAGKTGRQDVLQETAHPFERVQCDGGVPAPLAVAIRPADLAPGQQGHGAVVRGGLEDIAREIAQGIFAGARVLAADVPMTFPNLGGHWLEQIGMFLEQPFLEPIAEAFAQGLVVEKELVVHEVIQAFLMLGFAEARQVGVDGGDDGTFVAEVDPDLAEVLALFEQVGGVGMAQGVNVGVLFDAALIEGQTEGALEGGATHGLGGGGGAPARMPPGGEDQRGMTMRFPKFAQECQRAFGQRDVTILIALARADVKEAALGVNIADLEVQTFAQAQTAGIDRGQSDALIQGGHGGEEAAHLGSGKDDGKFELGIGADQIQFGGPEAFEGFLPEKFEGADDLGGGRAGDLFDGFEMEAILAELLGGDQIGGFGIKLGELAEAGAVGLLGARGDGEQRQVVGE